MMMIIFAKIYYHIACLLRYNCYFGANVDIFSDK